MIDAHCHLNFHAFKKDVDKVINDAKSAGITHIINVGTKIDSSEEAIKLAENYDGIYAAVGVHPHHSDKLEANWLEELEILAKNTKVIAIGECGLDKFHYKSNGIVDLDLQKKAFTLQIELAYKLKLPLQIHNRHAGEDILEILTDYKSYLINRPGMFHCFSGDKGLLRKVLDLGFYVGFDGNITYEGLAIGETTSLRELAGYAPIDRILVETDSPFLTPIPFRGSRNTPQNAIITGEFIAKLKNVSYNEFEKQILQNFNLVFSKVLRIDV